MKQDKLTNLVKRRQVSELQFHHKIKTTRALRVDKEQEVDNTVKPIQTLQVSYLCHLIKTLTLCTTFRKVVAPPLVPSSTSIKTAVQVYYPQQGCVSLQYKFKPTPLQICKMLVTKLLCTCRKKETSVLAYYHQITKWLYKILLSVMEGVRMQLKE